MDNLLQGLEHVVIYNDNILITGRTEEEHLRTLDKLLQILENVGMHLKKVCFYGPLCGILRPSH